MKRDRFHVCALVMTGVVQSFAGDFGFQKTLFAFAVDLSFAGPQ
jgi:hypothetical protein